MTDGKKRVPCWVWLVVKLAIAAAVIAWMFHKDIIRLSEEDLRQAAAHWHWLLLSLAGLMAVIFLQAVRWDLLLRAHDIRFRLGELFTLAMTGQFFSMITPGGVGGDAVKAYYTARDQEKKTAAATTVFVDRFLGLVTLFLVAAVVIAFDFDRLWNASVRGLNYGSLPGGRVLVLMIAGCIVAMALGSFVLMSARVRRSALFGALARLVPFRGAVGQVYEAVHHYRRRPGLLLWATVVSIVAQAPLYLMYYLYGLALGVDIQLWHCALIVPPAMVIRVLPLVPGGTGQGMAAMALLFPLVGVDKGGAIGALGDAMFFVLYLIGGVFFVFGKTRYRDVRAAAASHSLPEQE